MEQGKLTNREPVLWEKIFVVFILFVSTYAVFYLWQQETGVKIDPLVGNIFMQLLWSGIYVIILLLLLPRLRQVCRTALQEKLIWLLVGIVFLSIAWSEVPFLTFRGGVAILVNTVLGVYLVARFTRLQLLKLLAWTLGLGTVLSLAAALLWPEYAFHFAGGPLRGIYPNKNHLGPVVCLTVVVWLIYSVAELKKARIVGFCFCGLAIALLYLSESITSWIIFLSLSCLILIYLVFIRLYTRVPRCIIIATIGLALGCLVMLLFINYPVILDSLGKDSTFNGRTTLWAAVLDMIRQQPWLGYGYNAFWLDWEGPSRNIWQLLHWQPPNAHNGFLDVWLQLGLVGLMLFIISLVNNLYKSFILVVRRKNLLDMFPLLALVFMFTHNLAESTFMVPNNFFWILYVVLSFQINAEYKEQVKSIRAVKTPVNSEPAGAGCQGV